MDQIFAQAIAQHQAGQLQDAERLYHTILQSQPTHPDANHNLGVLLAQAGHHATGLIYLRAALELDPAHGQYTASYAEALLAAGRASDARTLLQSAMQRGLNMPTAQALLQRADTAALSGNAKTDTPPSAEIDQLVTLFDARNHVELESHARRLIERYPAAGIAWKALAISLSWSGNESLPVWQRTRELLPNDAEVQNYFGTALLNANLKWPSKNGDSGAASNSRQLQPLSMNGVLFNVTDVEKFLQGIELIKDSLFDKGATLFCSDNLITWNRNFSFLRDDFCLDILNSAEIEPVWKSIVWRTYVLLYFAELASKVDGDFAEFGCHTGHTVSQVIRKIDLDRLKKKYFLYDLFEWKEGDKHTRLGGHDDPLMHERVTKKFSEYHYVRIIKGSVPQSFSLGFPDRIAFAHIDMNHPDPEVGALSEVLPKLSRGGIVILDDYGWWGYRAQKIALDPIIKEHGLNILELPTGQGLIIN